MDQRTSAITRADEFPTAAKMAASYPLRRGKGEQGHLPSEGAAAGLEGLPARCVWRWADVGRRPSHH